MPQFIVGSPAATLASAGRSARPVTNRDAALIPQVLSNPVFNALALLFDGLTLFDPPPCVTKLLHRPPRYVATHTTEDSKTRAKLHAASPTGRVG